MMRSGGSRREEGSGRLAAILRGALRLALATLPASWEEGRAKAQHQPGGKGEPKKAEEGKGAPPARNPLTELIRRGLGGPAPNQPGAVQMPSVPEGTVRRISD